MEKPPSSLARSVMLGIAGGSLLGGLLLFGSALWARWELPPCTSPSDNECVLARELVSASTRWQIGGAIGLELLATGSLIWLREASRKEPA